VPTKLVRLKPSGRTRRIQRTSYFRRVLFSSDPDQPVKGQVYVIRIRRQRLRQIPINRLVRVQLPPSASSITKYPNATLESEAAGITEFTLSGRFLSLSRNP
jgi:hypothetical protein